MKIYLLALLLTSFLNGCNYNKCKNERFYCRDEKSIDNVEGLKFVKIYYNGELTEEYYSSIKQNKDSFYTDYVNGIKSHTIEYENGMQNGLAISFYNNGDTQLVHHYKNDTLNGECYGYFLNGKIKYRQFFKMGYCLNQQLFDSLSD